MLLFPEDSNDQGGGGNPAGGPAPSTGPTTPKTFTEDDLNRIVQRRIGETKDAERRAIEQQLIDKLGTANIEDVERLVKAQREREDAEKSEAQKAREAAEAEKAAAAKEREAAQAEAYGFRVQRALLKLGVDPDRAERATKLVDAKPGDDEATIEAAAQAVKEEIPELFKATSEGGGGKKPPPSSDPRGSSGTPPAPSGLEDAKRRGRERALAEMGKKAAV